MDRPDVTAEKVFATALRLPAGPARNSFLHEEIGANADLLQAVEQMLELHDQAGSFLELTALERDPSLLSGWNAHPAGVDLSLRLRGVWAEGSADQDGLGTIGHFKVLRLLGYGGFSIVLLAEDKLLGRQVALKLLGPEIAKDVEATQRFLREARSTAAIRDKHVVQVYEVGEQAGVPYLVMEYLPAGSLQSLLRTEGNLSIKDGLSILIQVAEALHATHRKGILHRDVKPSNVLIDQFPDRVKLSDFGLAHSVHDSGPEPVVGTPQFSSPEQLRGELVDHRTDLFSLGCLAYALLTGQSPFAGVSRIQTVQLTLSAEPEPLTRFGLPAPQELECLLQQLVAKRPAQRPSHILEVLNRLQAISASLDKQPGGSNLTPGYPHRRSW